MSLKSRNYVLSKIHLSEKNTNFACVVKNDTESHDTLGNFVVCNQARMLPATISRSVSCEFEATLLRK